MSTLYDKVCRICRKAAVFEFMIVKMSKAKIRVFGFACLLAFVSIVRHLGTRSDSADNVVGVQEFLNVCLKGAGHDCLGSRRLLASVKCSKVGKKGTGKRTKILRAHTASERKVYWSEQIERQSAEPVDGWLEVADAYATNLVFRIQDLFEITGGLAEIGVHHGKYSIWLSLHKRADESIAALDLFDNQAENLDGSGRGNKAAFLSNLQRYNLDTVQHKTYTVNSLKLPLCFFSENSIDNVRFFSVDGGHFIDSAYEDCWTAFSTLSAGGVIAVDDFAHGTDVLEGTLRFLYSNPLASAFLMGENKLFICHADYHERYIAAVQAELVALRIRFRTSAIAGRHQLCLPPTHALTLHGWFFPPLLRDREEAWTCDMLGNASYGSPTIYDSSLLW